MTTRFSAFLDRKDRLNKDHLRTLGKVLKRAGFVVKDMLHHHQDPYLYIKKPIDHDPIIETLEFGGVRLYARGNDLISFRPQNNEAAEPYGTAYLLDVKGMYKDLIKDHNDLKTGKDLVKYIVEELLNYFVTAAKAQHDDEKDLDDRDEFGKITYSGDTAQDYGSQVSGDLRRNQTN